MKNTIIVLLAVTLLVTSCSKKDSGNASYSCQCTWYTNPGHDTTAMYVIQAPNADSAANACNVKSDSVKYWYGSTGSGCVL